MSRWVVAGAIACALLSCTRDTTPSSEATAQARAPSSAPARAEVRWFGELRAIMHEGRTEAAARLADVVPGPHAWGVGALAGLDGEVTILNDLVWLARPNPDGTSTVTRSEGHALDRNVGAALLVVANVAAWDALAVPEVVPWSALDDFLASQLRARGESLDAPIPLRIDGPVTSLRWHVVDGSKMAPGAGHADHLPTAVSGVIERADVALVGFFSRAHQGVFTHAGSHSHFHVVASDRAVTGHVDSVDLQAGARLLVPRR